MFCPNLYYMRQSLIFPKALQDGFEKFFVYVVLVAFVWAREEWSDKLLEWCHWCRWSSQFGHYLFFWYSSLHVIYNFFCRETKWCRVTTQTYNIEERFRILELYSAEITRIFTGEILMTTLIYKDRMSDFFTLDHYVSLCSSELSEDVA